MVNCLLAKGKFTIQNVQFCDLFFLFCTSLQHCHKLAYLKLIKKKACRPAAVIILRKVGLAARITLGVHQQL